MSEPVSATVPGEISPVVDAMAGYPGPWALCGGWAVDAWLGRVTRDHGDIDVSVFLPDQRLVFEHLRGWQMVAHEPHVPDGKNAVWDGWPLEVPGHLHCRIDRGEPAPESGAMWPNDGYVLDLQLDDRDGADWLLSREPRITLPAERAIAVSPWGVPAVVPEVLLFFKARDLRRRDRVDFEALRPLLTSEQRAWLRDAINAVGHPWLSSL